MVATLPALPALLAAMPLQLEALNSTLGRLLLAVIAIGVIVFVGRFVLSIAWKLVVVAAVVIGALWVVSNFLPL